jgi:hypothetical protein
VATISGIGHADLDFVQKLFAVFSALISKQLPFQN